VRLLILVPWSERLGGAETMLWNFLRNVDSSRVESTVVLLEGGPFEQELAGLAGVQTHVVQAGRLRQLRVARSVVDELGRLIDASAPDLILSWAAKAQIYAALAAGRGVYRDRLVWWQHAIPTGHRMERAATLLPARGVGCSSTVAANAQARLWPRRHVFVVHPGIDSDEVPALSREELQIPKERSVVGIAGRLQPWKGQHRFLEMLATLRDRGHDVHGLVVGGDAHGLSPDYLPYLHQRVATLQLGDRITFTGHVPDPRPYIAAMDVLVNASAAEPFGIVIIEGMSQGVPVVAGADGGAADILEDGLSDLLVSRAEPHLLGARVEKLLVNPEVRRRLGAEARERFLEKFTAAAMAQALAARLEDLCPSGPIPAAGAAAA
jgi:glycosyltransferase involved in cell wall biosynthesis